MSFISWIIVGGIAGWLAGKIMKADNGCLANVVIGIIGGLIGGFLFSVAGGSGMTGFNPYSILVATIGAVILMGIVRLLKD